MLRRAASSSTLLTVLLGATLSLACGGGGDPGALHDLGGTIHGLTEGGLVLVLNEDEQLSVDAGTTDFAFHAHLASGVAYAVTVAQQPGKQICSIEHGFGVVHDTVTDIVVTCSTSAHAVAATVSGLTGAGFVLLLNGQPSPVSADGPFTFPTRIAKGANYEVSVGTQPSGQVCSVAHGSGTMADSDVSGVLVTCTTLVHVGGNIDGLVGDGLALALGGQTLLPAGNGAFRFPDPVAPGTSYAVTVASQPAWQTCTVANGTGTVGAADVTTVAVTCSYDAPDVWAVGDAGAIVHWTSAGWKAVASGTTSALRAVWGSGPGDLWAVGANGTILHSRGTTWQVVGAGVTSADLTAVWGAGPSDVWAVGGGGTIVHWDGTSWAHRGTGTTTNTLTDVVGTASSQVWAVGGTSLLSWNGTAWSAQTLTAAVTRMWASAAVPGKGGYPTWTVGAVTPGIGYVPYVNMFTTYVSYPPPTTSMLSCFVEDLWGTGAADVWAVGQTASYNYNSPSDPVRYGGWVAWHFDGTSWSVSPDLSVQARAVWSKSANAAYVVGGGGVTAQWDGSTWSSSALPSAVSGTTLRAVWGSGR